jgi:3-hydroxyethyl bacteriochlorophyllide a dehydrogenase
MTRPRHETTAVVIEEPKQLRLSRLALPDPGADDVVVEVAWSGISTGTERLLWSGNMPPFPGMGYPLVPGYEAVGKITAAGECCRARIGESVFVPGARCFGEVRGLFGGSASRLVVPSHRAIRCAEDLEEKATLLALAATAYHALAAPGARAPELIVGHGVLGRLLARLTIALGNDPPIVWETNRQRVDGAVGYQVIDPTADPRREYRAIYDVSGDAALLDALVMRLARLGEIVLAGFYSDRLSFSFPPAFMREARMRVAAEWQDGDLAAVSRLVESRHLSLDGLITHRSPARDAPAAYPLAFSDPSCLKMILDWSACS